MARLDRVIGINTMETAMARSIWAMTIKAATGISFA
jgi:hypothetical protein